MGQTSIQITLADEDAIEFVRSKVRSGEYASEADVVLDGLGTLRDDAEQQALWEREVLIPAHERLMAEPDSAVTVDVVLAELEVARQERLKTS
jgi:antitoxin ParD1/3/4